MSATSVLTVGALLGLGGVSAALYSQNRDLSRRLDEVAAALGRPVERAAAPAPAHEGPTLQGAPATLAEVTALRRQLEAQLEQMAARVTSQEKKSAAAGAAGGAVDFETGVRDVLSKVQDEPAFKQKVAEAAGKPAIDKKPTFAALSQHLTLDGTQEAAFRRDLEDIQGSLFALLSETRPDGRVLLEEIQKSEALPEGDPGRMNVFIDLVKLKIPGTEQTYLERAVDLAVGFRKKADAYLTPEQRQRFATLDVDLFGVKMN